jgi:hypothetical protein
MELGGGGIRQLYGQKFDIFIPCKVARQPTVRNSMGNQMESKKTDK